MSVESQAIGLVTTVTFADPHNPAITATSQKRQTNVITKSSQISGKVIMSPFLSISNVCPVTQAHWRSPMVLWDHFWETFLLMGDLQSCIRSGYKSHNFSSLFIKLMTMIVNLIIRCTIRLYQKARQSLRECFHCRVIRDKKARP